MAVVILLLIELKEKYPNFNFEIVGYSEIDKYACELYDLNHKDKMVIILKILVI